MSEKTKSHIVWLGSSEKLQSREGIRVEARRGSFGKQGRIHLELLKLKHQVRGAVLSCLSLLVVFSLVCIFVFLVVGGLLNL